MHNLVFFIGGYFNQPLSNSLNKLTNLQHLTFGEYFNQPLNSTLCNLINLQHLTLGTKFDQNIDLPFNIVNLTLYCNNNQYIIDNLHYNIVTLEFIGQFDLELNDLPTSIKYIKINVHSTYNKQLNNLPNSLECIELNLCYNQKINKIPKNLKTIKCSKYYKFISDFNNYEIITY